MLMGASNIGQGNEDVNRQVAEKKSTRHLMCVFDRHCTTTGNGIN
jgi:hypothetical protein